MSELRRLTLATLVAAAFPAAVRRSGSSSRSLMSRRGVERSAPFGRVLGGGGSTLLTLREQSRNTPSPPLSRGA